MLSVRDLCSQPGEESNQTAYIDLVTPSSDPSKSPTDYLIFNKKVNQFRVTKNITAAFCQLVHSIPDTFQCHPDGYATIILNRSSSGGISAPNSTSVRSNMTPLSETQGFTHSILRDAQYSLSFPQAAKSTTITLEGIKYKSTRKTATCSGSVECIYSTKSNNFVSTSSSQQNTLPNQPLVENIRQDVCYQERLARQLFFVAQTKFPQVCDHLKNSSFIENNYYDRQHRAPNWRLVKGKHIARKIKVIRSGVHDLLNIHSSRLPDFIGCAEYRNLDESVSKCCSRLKLLADLQDCDLWRVNKLISDSLKGNFPPPFPSQVDRCPALTVSTRAEFCGSQIHGYEAVPLERIPCSTKYHSIIPSNGSFMVVVGIGHHKHYPPGATYDKNFMKSLVFNQLQLAPRSTTNVLCTLVSEQPDKILHLRPYESTELLFVEGNIAMVSTFKVYSTKLWTNKGLVKKITYFLSLTKENVMYHVLHSHKLD